MKRLLLLVPVLGLVACAGQHPEAADTTAYGEAAPNSDAVRNPGRVHTYLVNDYIDPNNPRLLHRGHPVEVVEEDETWNLNAADSTDGTNGPVATVNDPNAAPNPYSAEFETELAQQRDQSRQLAAMGAQMNAEMDRLAQMAQKEAEAVSDNAALRERLEALQREIDELKTAPTRPVAPNAPRKSSWFGPIWDLFRQVPEQTPDIAAKPEFATNLVLRPAEMASTPPAPCVKPPPVTLPSAGPLSEVSVVASPGEMAQPDHHNP